MRRATRFLGGLAVLGLMVSAEEASATGRGWLEKLSGPGPFVGIESPTLQLWCFPREEDLKPTKDYPAELNLRWKGFLCNEQQAMRPGTRFISLTYSRLKSQQNNLEYDPEVTGDTTVKLDSLAISFDVRLHPGLDVGTGLGYNRFSGDVFSSFSRLSLEPLRVVVRPFGLILPRTPYKTWKGVKFSIRDLLQIKVRTTLFPEGFEAKHFGARGTFQEPSELLLGYSFTFGIFVWW